MTDGGIFSPRMVTSVASGSGAVAGAEAAAGESLLDHESLTVTGAGRTAVLPLRVLGSLTRMGFLGDRGEPVVVSIAAGWTRLAGAYGSAYQHAAPGLTLGPR